MVKFVIFVCCVYIGFYFWKEVLVCDGFYVFNIKMNCCFFVIFIIFLMGKLMNCKVVGI